MVISIYYNFDYFFQKSKPYLKDIIDNEYVLDIVLGVINFYNCNFFSFDD